MMMKTMMIDGVGEAKLDDYYVYKDGGMFRRVQAGELLDRDRPNRIIGKWKIFIDSFSHCALPYSVYHLANTETGEVYSVEVLLRTGVDYRKRIVEWLKKDD